MDRRGRGYFSSRIFRCALPIFTKPGVRRQEGQRLWGIPYLAVGEDKTVEGNGVDMYGWGKGTYL